MGSLEALGEVFMPLSWLLRVTSNPWHSFALGFQNSNLRLHLSSCGFHFESLHPVSFCLSGKLAIVFRAHPDDLIATFLITSSKTSQKGRILRFLVDITLEASIQFITNTNPHSQTEVPLLSCVACWKPTIHSPRPESLWGSLLSTAQVLLSSVVYNIRRYRLGRYLW